MALQESLKNLAGYGPAPLPSKLDSELEALVEGFRRTGSRDVPLPAPLIDRLSNALLTYAERMASLAVREHSVERINSGLGALVLEDLNFDARETQIRLALLYDAAVRIGADPDQLFNSATVDARADAAELLERFPSRSAEDRSIDAMGYAAVLADDGFIYERFW